MYLPVTAIIKRLDHFSEKYVQDHHADLKAMTITLATKIYNNVQTYK